MVHTLGEGHRVPFSGHSVPSELRFNLLFWESEAQQSTFTGGQEDANLRSPGGDQE